MEIWWSKQMISKNDQKHDSIFYLTLVQLVPTGFSRFFSGLSMSDTDSG